MECVTNTCTAVVTDVTVPQCNEASCTIDVIEIIDDGCERCEVTVKGGCKDVLVKSCQLDDCILCCDPHQSKFFWNNWCLCEGAEVISYGENDAENSLDPTRGVNVCDCNYVSSWKFSRFGTYSVTLPEAKPLDAVIVWGHDLYEGSTDEFFGVVEVYGDGVLLQSENWDAAFASVDSNEPVIMHFDGTSYSRIEVLAIGPENLRTYCIDNIFIGQALDVPDGLRKFNNPFNASEYEAKFKSSECGPLSRQLSKRAIDVEIELAGLCEEWIVENWREFLNYAIRYPFYFAWSTNRYPQEVFRAWIDGVVDSSEYSDSHFQTISLALKAQTSQGLNK